MKQIVLFLNKKSLTFLIVWICILSILYSTLSIVRHNTFQSGAFDLGIYDQSVWQYSRFQYPYNTIKDRFILGDHLALTLPLLAPLFWIWDDVRMLLLFQAVWVSVSALPIFLLIKQRGYSPLTALNLSIVYSLFYGIQFLLFFDFHPVAVGVGLIPWMLYFLESKRKRLFALALILLLLTQENMGLALASLGCVYVFQKKYRRVGGFFIGLGIIASVIAVLLVKQLSPIGFEYTPQIERNPITLLTEFFDAPEKRTVWLYSFSWFSFVPLLSPGAILGASLDLAQYFVTGEGLARMWSPFMHHRAILASVLLLGTLDGFEVIKKMRNRLYPASNRSSRLISFARTITNPTSISIGMVFIAFFLQFYFHFALNKLSKPMYYQHEAWMDDNNRLFAQIPRDASIAASQNLVPHLSHRKEIYLLYPREHEVTGDPCGRQICWWLDFSGEPEFMVVNLRPNQPITQLLETNEHFGEAVRNMEKAKKVTLIQTINQARLYKVNY